MERVLVRVLLKGWPGYGTLRKKEEKGWGKPCIKEALKKLIAVYKHYLDPGSNKLIYNIYMSILYTYI